MKHKIVIKGIAAVLCAACCSFGVAAQPIQEDVILYPEHEQIRQEIQQLEQLEQWGVQQQEATRLHLQLSEEQWGSLVQNTAPPVWLSFLQLPYGKSELLERYIQQWEQTPEWTAEEIVTWVNANLDLPFYEQTVMAENPNSLTVLVNKYSALGAEFEPELVKMDAAYTTVPNAKMQPVAYEAFVKMAEAASQDGFRLYSVSAYRSYQTQKRLYQTYVATDGLELAESYSARPGYSEHQTGLSVDINTADFYSNFQNTDTYRWLRENSWKYGFILRYPEGKERITGYQFEPWHYRYVGVEIAQTCEEQGLTYEEYLARQVPPQTDFLQNTSTPISGQLLWLDHQWYAPCVALARSVGIAAGVCSDGGVLLFSENQRVELHPYLLPVADGVPYPRKHTELWYQGELYVPVTDFLKQFEIPYQQVDNIIYIQEHQSTNEILTSLYHYLKNASIEELMALFPTQIPISSESWIAPVFDPVKWLSAKLYD